MRVVVRASAAADIEDACGWYRRQRDSLGAEFLAEVRETMQRVLEQPVAYPVLWRDLRRIRLRRFPYAIFYRIYPKHIVVVACLHGRRDPGRWKSRA